MINRLLDINQLDESLYFEVQSDKALWERINEEVINLWKNYDLGEAGLTDWELFNLGFKRVMVKELFEEKTGVTWISYKQWDRLKVSNWTDLENAQEYQERISLVDALEMSNINDLYREFRKDIRLEV